MEISKKKKKTVLHHFNINFDKVIPTFFIKQAFAMNNKKKITFILQFPEYRLNKRINKLICMIMIPI